jgi:O-antigen/teichoic acid export membrane protein
MLRLKAGSKFITYLFSEVFSKAVPFLVLPVIAIYLTPEDFGKAANFLIISNLFAALVSFSSPSFLSVQFFRKNVNRKTLIKGIMVLNVISFVVILVIASFFKNLIYEYYLIPYYWQFLALIMGLATVFFDLFSTNLRMLGKARYFLIIKSSFSFLSAGLSYLFVAILGFMWEGRAGALLLTSGIMGVLSAVLIYPKKSGKINLRTIFEAINYGIGLIPHRLSSWVKRGVESAFISSTISVGSFGVFSLAQNFSSVTTILASSFSSVYAPSVYSRLSLIGSKTANEGYSLKKRIVIEIYLALCGFAILLVLGYCVFSQFFDFFFDPSYSDVLRFLPYLLFAGFFNLIYVILSLFIFYSKKTKVFGLLSFALSIISTLLNVYFISKFGVLGACYGAIIASFLKMLMTLFVGKSNYQMPWLLSLYK